MTPSVDIKLPAIRRHRREMLLSGSALCGAVMLMALPAQAQTLPGIPLPANIKVDAAGAQPVITAPNANTLDVALNASRTVINWASFQVGGSDAVNFHFVAGSDIVLNKSPTQVTVADHGHVTGDVGGVTGGNIWFYSPAGVLISPGAVMTAGNFVFARGTAIDDLLFVADANPLAFLRAASDSLIVTNSIGTATQASIDPVTGDVVLSSATDDIKATTAVSVGKVTITATVGLADIGELTANGGAASVTAGASATVTTAHAKGDLTISGKSVTLTNGDATGDVLLTASAGDARVIGSATAGDDVEVKATGGNVEAGAATLTSQGTGTDDGHVLAQSTDHSVNLLAGVTQGSGVKAGDVTVDGKTGVTVGGGSDSSHDFIATSATGDVSVGGSTAKNDLTVTATAAGKSASLTTGKAGHDIKVTGPIASLTSGDTDTGDILVTASAGAATVGDHANAGDDVEVKATGGNAEAGGATLTSRGAGADDGHVLVQSDHAANLGAGVTLGTGATAGDVTVHGDTGVTVGGGSDSSRDFVVTGPVVNLTSAHAARDLIATGTVSASVGAGRAGRNIQVTGPTASLTSGDTDTGDILVTASAGAATVGDHANAGDDVEVKATGGNVEAGGATLTSKGAGADDGHVLVQSDHAANLGAGVTLGAGATAGDVTVHGDTGVAVGAGSNSSQDFIITGPAVDLASGRATRDLIVTGTISASVGAGRAGRDIKVTGPTASLTSGDTDTGDILVTASAGAATVGDHANAGDDVEVKATGGNVEAGNATLTSKGAGADDGHVLAQSTDMLVKLGAGVTKGSGANAGDVTVDGHTGVIVGSGSDSSQDFIATPPTGDVSVVGSVHAHRDVIVSPVAGSVIGSGDFAADRDIAISTSTGSISIGSANAGDDVVMRAPLGAINAAGNIRAGRDNNGTPAADADGAGDALNAAHPFLDFDAAPTTIFSTVGYDVSLAAQAIHVTGSTVAGHQPSTDALGAGGPVDTTTSDVRIQTLVGPTPTASLDPSISLGAVIATRDIQIDSYKAITTGGLQAGRDIAVLGRGGATPGGAATHGGDVQIGSAHAGDDVVIYSIFGHAHVLGDVTSGLTFAEFQPNTDVTVDGATQAADQLAIYLHYFDLDETSKPGKPTGAILIRGETVTVGGNMQAVGSGSDISLRSAGNLTVQGDAHAGANATFTTEAAGGATLSLNTVTAEGAISVDGGAVPGTGNTVSANGLHANGGDTTVRGHAVNLGTTTASGDVIVTGDTVTMGGTSAGGDVAVSGGSVTLGTTSAGDDVVVRAGDITLHGDVTAGGGTDANNAGDALVASGGAVTLEGQTFDVGGRHDVDIKATGTVTADAGTLTADNVRVQAPGKISINNANAARDVLIDGQAEVATGNLNAGRDVGVRSTGEGFDVTVGGATAKDDVIIRGKQNIVTGALVAQGQDSDDSTAADQAGDLMFNAAKSHLGASPAGDFSTVGRNVDVRSTKGSIEVGGANADTEVRIQTEELTGGSVTTIGAVTAGQNVLLDGKGVSSAGALTATNHDVAIRGREGSNVSLGNASAGDDVVIRTGGNVTAGNVAAGVDVGANGGGLGEKLAAIEGAIVLEGHAYDLSGHNVDIKAGGVGTGRLEATNDVRVQAGGGIGVGDANAGRDVLIDAGQTVTTGTLKAGRDVGVRSTGDGFDVTVGGASAGDDVVIRGARNITTGALAAQGGDSTATDQAGDLMYNVAKTKLNGDLSITGGRNVDVRSTKGSITVTGPVIADTDVRFQTEQSTGGSVRLANDATHGPVDVTAGENVLLDGKGVEVTGTAKAQLHDVAVRGREGSDVKLADVSAGDEVVIRASGSVTTGNADAGVGLGANGGGLGERLLATDGAIVLEGHNYDLTGHNVDIKAGGVGTGGLSATNDVRVQAGGNINVASANAGRDVLLDGAASVTTGDLTAGRDVGVRSTYDGTDAETGAVVVHDVTAKDDVVIRGKRNITAGKLTAQGADSTATDQAGDLMFGAAKTRLNGDLSLAGQNVDVRSTKGAITVSGLATADTDVRLQTDALTGGSVKVANVTAGQNVLLDGATVEATGALVATNADVAVRARGGSAKLANVTAGDDVAIRATGDATAGAVTTQGKANSDGLADKLIADAGRLTVEGHAFDVGGSDVDVVSGSATIDNARAAGSIRIKTGSAAKLTTGTADTGEILIDSAGSVSADTLTAGGGDIAVRATGGDVTVATATAGDDVVLRATGSINAGALVAGGGSSEGAGDLLFGANPTTLGGSLSLSGGNIDVKANGAAAVGTARAGADIRLQAGGEAKLSGTGTAGRDILLDGASVIGGELHANGGDLALYGRNGSATLGSATASDDIAIRATGGVNVTGLLTSSGGGDSNGVADRLIGVAGGIAVAGAVFDLNGAAIDVRGAEISVGGAITAGGASGNVRLQSAGALTVAGASATADVLLDAGGQVSTLALSAGRDVGVRSTGGALTIASASAGDDVVLRASKAITVTGALTARGEADGVGAGDLVFNSDATDLGGALDLTGSNVDLKSSGGPISAMGTINAGADVRLQTTGAGEVNTGDIVAGRDVLLDGATATAGAVKGGRDIAVRAQAGAIALGSADAKDDLVLRATGDIKLAGTASAQGGADGVGAGDRLFNTDRTKLNGDFDLAGANVDAKSSGGAIGFTGQVSAGRDVRLQTTGGGAISIAGVETASGDIFADGGSVSATGALKAAGDVALRARTGTVEVASISAGDDIAIRASGTFKANGALSSGSGANANGAADRLISTSESGMILRQTDPASAAAAEGFTLAGGDIDIRSGGAITLGALNAAGKSNVHLQSPGDISLGTVSADTIFARASSLHMGGVWTATSARIESTAAGGVSLGSGVTGGMELSNDQINLINAGTLEIFAGDTSGAMRGTALQIGTLSIDVAKVKTALRLYAGSGVEVRITGVFAPSSTAANSTVVSIGANAMAGNWTPKTIKVIADNGGAIGFSTTRDGRAFDGVRAFGGVELNAANDILIGFQDFIDKMAATNAADVSNVAKTFHAAQGPDGSRILITAGALSLRADGKVAQQDTSAVGGLTRTGVFLIGSPTPGAAELTVDSMTHSTVGTVVMPQYVELYGALKNNTTVLANESTALSNLIVLRAKPSQYYRLNTCVIFQTGTCTPAGGAPNTNIAPDRLTALNILDRTDAAGAADPTVASATNEEIWKSPE